MPILETSKRLKKELTLFNISTIGIGATIASGFFLLPGLAAAQAGPAVILSYLIAAVPVFPALFSKAELATAMPRAGGVYYFLDRSMGPLLGTIGGVGTWLAIALKTAFALVGMGAYISHFFPNMTMLPLAVGFAVFFGFLNLFGAKKSGILQSLMVLGLLILLGGFIFTGMPELKPQYFSGFFDKGAEAIFSTAGLVYVSYMGLTKIASLSEEVQDPERNIPWAMFLALGTAILVYIFGTLIMVGVVPADDLHHDLTPVATAAKILVGPWGAILMSGAAILAFFSVANAGILSASRYPLAMSRDYLFPGFFSKLSKQQTPKNSIYVTVGLVILFLVMFDPTKIAKLASSFQLLLFALNCLAVIVMRESRIASYDPGYRSPLYPWMQIFGIIFPLWLITEMGILPIFFTIGMIVVGSAWYFYYARERVVRDGAIYHMFARWGEHRFEGLDRELRSILKEKGLREKDPFDVVIANASIIDITGKVTFGEVVGRAAARLDKKFPGKGEMLVVSFMEGTRVGATPVSHGIALPHVRLPDIDHPEMIMVRCQQGVSIEIDDEFLGEHSSPNPIHAFFFLVSPEEDPGQHLRILAQIAGHADDETFLKRWLSAHNEQEMKEILLRDDRFISLMLEPDSKAASLVGYAIRDLNLPPGSLIAMIHRGGEIIFPRGRTVLREGDRMTIIGEPKGIQELYERYFRG
jgi:amino acid transporter/mannitol/fructose-specific phosphotransferase system IIA component (Ntr-type)